MTTKAIFKSSCVPKNFFTESSKPREVILKLYIVTSLWIEAKFQCEFNVISWTYGFHYGLRVYLSWTYGFHYGLRVYLSFNTAQLNLNIFKHNVKFDFNALCLKTRKANCFANISFNRSARNEHFNRQLSVKQPC